MRDNYDFSNGIKNPYAAQLKQGYSVTVHYDFADKDESAEDTCLEAKTDKDAPEPHQA